MYIKIMFAVILFIAIFAVSVLCGNLLGLDSKDSLQVGFTLSIITLLACGIGELVYQLNHGKKQTKYNH